MRKKALGDLTPQQDVTRRAFLLEVLAAGAAPFVATGCRAFGRGYAANARVRLACVGVGHQAWHDIQMFLQTGLCDITALCDVDMGGKQTLPACQACPEATRLSDFRTLFDKCEDSFDAVAVMTPDHAHFAAALQALRSDKGVFVEKPLAQTFRETQLLIDAARNSSAVTQMGNQGHSGPNYHQLKHYVETGILKPADVASITAFMNYPRRWHKWNGQVAGLPPAEAKPATLDWNLWLAQRPAVPYSHDYTSGEWRSWYAFGDGCLGDWGAHLFDTCHRFFDLGLPSRVEITSVTGHNPYVFPMQDTLTFTFPATSAREAIKLHWYEGLTNIPNFPKDFRRLLSSGARPKRENPSTPLHPGRLITMRDGSAWQGGSHGSPLYRVGVEGKPPAYPKSTSNHYANFLKAVRGEEAARSPFAVSGPLSQAFCLGCIAQRLGRGFDFDPSARRILNDAAAQALLEGPAPRKGWEAYYA